MDFNGFVNDPQKAVLFAECIQLLTSRDAQANIDALLRTATANPVFSVLMPGGPNVPTYYYGETAVARFLFVNGSETLGQANGYWNGALGGPLSPPFGASNSWLIQAANLITATMNGASFSRRAVLWVSGWSLGGAVAEVLALNWISTLGYTPNVVTFGSPRAIDQADATRLDANRNVIRWMTDSDPVPLIPPSFAEAPSVALLYGVRASRRIAQFVHPGGGLSLDGVGNPSNAVVPPNAVLNISGSVASFISGEDSVFGDAHAIAEYVRRLTALVQSENTTHRRPPAGAPTEHPNPTHEREMNRVVRAQAAALFKQASVQDAREVVVPPTFGFVAFRSSGLWMVALGDQAVAIGPSRRRARAFAREGNKWIRRMLTMGVTEAEALQTQLADFLTQAQDPTSGIVPTLATTIPPAGG
jgi:hypothetical protein